MEDKKINFEYEKNEYLFRILYLIRKNIPSSQILYVIMFFLKSVGLILLSISLNEWKKNNKKTSNNNRNDISSSDITYFFLSNFLINQNNLEILNYNYQEICLIGFFILMIYIVVIIYCFVDMRNKYYNKNFMHSTHNKIKNINKSKFQKKLFKILTYIFFLIVFFHQYLIEYYMFGFFGYISYYFGLFNSNNLDNINENYSKEINNHLSNLNINPIILIITNSITIIIIFILFIIFIVINSVKTLFLDNGVTLYTNTKNLIIKIIILNFNPLYGILNSFNYIKLEITFIFNILFLIILLFDIFIMFYNFSFYPSIMSFTCIFLNVLLIISFIMEIFIYLTNSNQNTLKFNLIKILIILSNTIFITILFIHKKKQRCAKLFEANLFRKSFINLNPDDIYYYFKVYIEYSKNTENNYLKIFRLIQNHIISCKKQNCPGKKLIPKEMSYSIFTDFSQEKKSNKKNELDIKYYNSEEKDINYNETTEAFSETNIFKSNLNILESNENQSRTTIKEDLSETKNNVLKKKKTVSKNIKINKTPSSSQNNKKSFINKNNDISIILNNNEEEINDNNDKDRLTKEQFQIIGEQEIINRINYLYKQKDYLTLNTYIFIHIQYLMKIKANYRLALYFIEKYLYTEIKLSTLSRYFLYEMKKDICKSILNVNNLNRIKDPFLINYRIDNIEMKFLVKYIEYYNMIKHFLKTSCEKFIYFYNFRMELRNSLSLQKYAKSKSYSIINAAKEIKSSISKLNFLINKMYQEQKHHLESIELSYLICNFFKLIRGKISQEKLKKIIPIFYFKPVYYEKLLNEFNKFRMSEPLVISLTKKDSFIVLYATNNFLEKLEYSSNDILYKDFHEKLFPGDQELIKEHTLMLKQFLFFYKNVYAKDKTFLKSKEGFLISINFICKLFPNFSYSFTLIADITFNDELLDKNPYSIMHKPKSNNFKNDNLVINKYSFLLNSDFDFFGLTKNFYLEYYLSQSMFRELRINFCQFFSIDENKLIIQMRKERIRNIKKFPNLNHKLTMKELNNAYTIFKDIKTENLFQLRDNKHLENYFFLQLLFMIKLIKRNY